MTAEALACRHFLGLAPDTRTTDEATQYLLSEPPGDGEPNFYYWYYGTLAMFQAGGDAWKQWLKAMESAIVDSQRRDGCAKGSWDPVGPWGAEGGRVYSTALMVMCLEVYYRYGEALDSFGTAPELDDLFFE